MDCDSFDSSALPDFAPLHQHPADLAHAIAVIRLTYPYKQQIHYSPSWIHQLAKLGLSKLNPVHLHRCLHAAHLHTSHPCKTSLAQYCLCDPSKLPNFQKRRCPPPSWNCLGKLHFHRRRLHSQPACVITQSWGGVLRSKKGRQKCVPPPQQHLTCCCWRFRSLATSRCRLCSALIVVGWVTTRRKQGGKAGRLTT